MYNYFDKTKAFLRVLMRVDSCLIFILLLDKKMLKENCIRMLFSCYKNNIKSHQVFVHMVSSPPFW